MCGHQWIHTECFESFISCLSSLCFSSCSRSRTKELHKCQLALSVSIVSLNPKLTKESACANSHNKADSYQSLQSSRPSPFTPDLHPPNAPPHPSSFLQWPSSDLSAFVLDQETFPWVLKANRAAWKSEAQARIAQNVNLNGGGEFGPERLWHVYWQNSLE